MQDKDKPKIFTAKVVRTPVPVLRRVRIIQSDGTEIQPETQAQIDARRAQSLQR